MSVRTGATLESLEFGVPEKPGPIVSTCERSGAANNKSGNENRITRLNMRKASVPMIPRSSASACDGGDVSTRQRNREREGAAGARRALDLDAAAVRLDGELAKCQAEAGADFARIELSEFLEDSLECFGRDAFPGVADC